MRSSLPLSVQLNHVLLRPHMYVGEGPEASNSLAWFINGYIAAVQGFGIESLICKNLCLADPNKTLAENAAAFKAQLEAHKSFTGQLDEFGQ